MTLSIRTSFTTTQRCRSLQIKIQSISNNGFAYGNPFRRSWNCKALIQTSKLASIKTAAQVADLTNPVEIKRLDEHLSTHISKIRITDFALVDNQQVTLHPGLNVITGESGSGKSVLLEAIGQLLGSTASEDLIRQPATTAVVEGHITIASHDIPTISSLLQSLGVPQRARSSLEGGTGINIRREIILASEGSGKGKGVRSRCLLNGCATSLRVLRELGDALVDVNGQHSAVSLRNPAQQLDLLDRLAGLQSMADALTASWRQLQQSRAKLKALDELSNEENRQALQQLADDVAEAGVEPGEDILIRQELRQLDGRRSAAERCRLVLTGIGGDGGGLLDALQDVEGHLRAMTSQEERLAAAQALDDADNGVSHTANGDLIINNDEEDEEGTSSSGGGSRGALALLEEASEAMNAAREAFYNAEAIVEKYGRLYQFSQAEYAEKSERLQQLERLLKQYDCRSVDDLLAAAEAAENKLDAYFQASGNKDALEAEKLQLEGKVASAAIELSKSRRNAARTLRKAVEAVLRDLAMEGSSFDIKFSWQESSSGTLDDGIVLSSEQISSCREISTIYDDDNGQQRENNSSGCYKIRSVSGSSTLDTVEFLFAASPGEPLRPLSAVASGGEAARLMLALKAAPSFSSSLGTTTPSSSTASDTSRDDSSAGIEQTPIASGSSTPVLVLDEIDSGVGSRLGQPIGSILRRMVGSPLSSSDDDNGEERNGQYQERSIAVASQVLAVSHLPQVAAVAEHHHVVRKSAAGDGRVVTRFATLSTYDERIDEVTAMLGLPRAAAEELVASSGWKDDDDNKYLL